MKSDIQEYYASLDKRFIFEGGLNSIEDRAQSDRLSEMCANYNAKNIMEIGFNAGHSADLFLSCREDIKLVSFDLGIHEYVSYGKTFIDFKYPFRHSLILGDSKKTVPEFAAAHQDMKFDLIFIDGDHSELGALHDLVNCKKLAHASSVVVLDDTRKEHPMKSWNIGPNVAWQKCKQGDYVTEISSEDYNAGNCPRGQTWGFYNNVE